MRTALGVVVILLVLPAAAAAKPGKGGGADRTVSLGQLATDVRPGQPWTATVIVRDTSGRAIDGPLPGVTLVDGQGARRTEFAVPTAQPGTYQVAFDTLAAGTYSMEADNGLGFVTELGKVAIPEVSAGTPASGGDGELPLPLAIALGLGALALLSGVALVVRTRRGGGPSVHAA